MSWNSSCLSVFRWRTSNASLKPDSLSSCSFFVFFYFCFVILIVFTFLVPCCDVHYEFCLKRCSVRLYLQLFVRWLVSYCVFFFVFSDVQHFVLSYVFTFCVLCCDVRCEFRSSQPPVVCWRAHVLFTLFVSVCVCRTHIDYMSDMAGVL